MSVAKAMLIAFSESDTCFVMSGDLGLFHRAIDIAGASHAGPSTKDAVLSCLNSSPYWTTDGWTRGWNNGRARVYVPSDKGRMWFDKFKHNAKDQA